MQPPAHRLGLHAEIKHEGRQVAQCSDLHIGYNCHGINEAAVFAAWASITTIDIGIGNTTLQEV